MCYGVAALMMQGEPMKGISSLASCPSGMATMAQMTINTVAPPTTIHHPYVSLTTITYVLLPPIHYHLSDAALIIPIVPIALPLLPPYLPPPPLLSVSTHSTTAQHNTLTRYPLQ